MKGVREMFESLTDWAAAVSMLTAGVAYIRASRKEDTEETKKVVRAELADQKLDTRLTLVEAAVIGMKDDMREVKSDVKELVKSFARIEVVDDDD